MIKIFQETLKSPIESIFLYQTDQFIENVFADKYNFPATWLQYITASAQIDSIPPHINIIFIAIHKTIEALRINYKTKC